MKTKIIDAKSIGKKDKKKLWANLKPPKMGSKWVERHGKKFQSIKEADRYDELLLLEKAGEIEYIKTQVNYDLCTWDAKSMGMGGHWLGVKICSYRLDFKYKNIKTDEWIYEDVKGRRAGPAYDLFKLKKKWMFYQYAIEITEV